MIAWDVPVIPDGDEARRLAEDELQQSVYAVAEPNLVDRIASAVRDWFENLLRSAANAQWTPLWLGVIAVVVIAIIVVVVVVWGRPRAVLRSRARTRTLFGDDDARSADDLRGAAEAQAAAGAFGEAVVLRVRAVARALDERGVLALAPGATVQAFARDASAAFGAHGAELAAVAVAFDDVRYLRRTATAAAYARVRSLDDALAAARPERGASPVGAAIGPAGQPR